MPRQSSTVWSFDPVFNPEFSISQKETEAAEENPFLLCSHSEESAQTLVRTFSGLFDEKELKRKDKTIYIIAHAGLLSLGVLI